VSLILAIVAWPHAVHEHRRRGVNAAVFNLFRMRPIKGAGREIVFLVDCGQAHRMRKAGAFVQPLGRKLRWFFLLPYAPDRRPGRLVRKHQKAAGRPANSGKDGFARKVRSSMRQLQIDPRKIRSFYQKPSLKHAA